MINGANTRRLYESFVGGGAEHDGVGGPAGFVKLLHTMVGLTEDAEGRKVVDVKNRKMTPQSIPLAELAKAIIGEDAAEQMQQPSGSDYRSLLQEDATDAVQPSMFNNISVWNVAAAGLLEVMVLEAYQRHSFLGGSLCRTYPSRLRQQKMIGHSIIGDVAEDMKPGQRHPRAQFGERYVTTPTTKKRGLGIDVTREAVFFDATNGGVMQQAESIGGELGLRKERVIIDQFIGVTNGYNYGGTAYNTYQASTPWINSLSNPLVNFADVDDALQLFAGMTDQEKGEPVIINPVDILVQPANRMNAKTVLFYDKVERVSATATEIGHGPNPLKEFGFNLLPSSVLLYRRLTDADGLNLSAANAKQRWYMGDFQGAFGYMENWSVNTARVAANDYTMADQDLIFSLFVNEMGISATIEPRKVVVCTH